MGLSESIEKILLNSNGQITLEKINELLGEKYARQTILDFLQNEKALITFDGELLTLPKYPLQYFIRILEGFIGNTGANRKDVFYLGAFYLYLRRQFPELAIDRIQDLNSIPISSDSDDLNFVELVQISRRLGDTFVNAMNHFFISGWIERLDLHGFYAFSQEFFEYYINSSGSGRELFTTPATLVELICRICPITRPLKVYNPAAGMLKLLTAIRLNSKFEFVAEASEINQETHKIGRLFAKTNGFELNFRNADSLDEIENFNPSAFDLIVSIPPFMDRINHYQRRNLPYRDVALNIISGSIKKLRENGMAVFLVADSVLFGQSREYRRFRREIIEGRLIHTIVSLPVNLFAPVSSVKSSLLIFRKGIHHEKVKFIDASTKDFYSVTRERTISLNINKITELIDRPSQPNLEAEEQAVYGIPKSLEFDFHQLKEADFSLNLNDYFIKYIQPQGPDYIAMAEFATYLRLPSNSGSPLPYLRITNLNGGFIDGPGLLSTNQSRTNGKVLNESAILIGTVGGSSKPTWYKSDIPVELSTNIVALKTDKGKVNNEYLIQELNSTYVQKQFEFLSLGSTTLRHLRVEDLLKVKVKLPSIEEQLSISRNRQEFIQEHAFIAKSEPGTITDADIFKTINHEIGNILKGPQGFIDLLPDFLIRNNISLDQPIVDLNETISIGNMISMAGKQIQIVFEVMQNMKGILFSEKKYFKAGKTELKKYFREKMQTEINHQDIHLYIGVDNRFINPMNIYAEIDPVQFQYIIRNIVTNAINHSGISETSDVQLNLFVNINSLENEIEIHFMNNGNTFPSDFITDDYLRFNKKSGDSEGQGLGGYLIGRVVENHHGKIKIQSEKRVIEVPGNDGNIFMDSNVDVIITIPKTQ